jgi:predicted phage terminase large subunit-like protein
MKSLSKEQVIAGRRFQWEAILARATQLPDDSDWVTWLFLAGRGAGKTRTAAEYLAWQAIVNPETRWAIVAPTHADARDTCVEGESGILNVLRDYGVLQDYNRSRSEIFLTNKSRIKLYSGEEPDRLRGPQFHGGWFDELAAFKYPEAWDQYQFGARLGTHPRTIVTTTPRPTKLIKDLLKRDSVRVVRGSTFDNAKNLAPSALAELRLRYENTRLGRQELYGEVLEEVEGALWTRDTIESARVTKAPPLVRIVVGVDPAVTSGETSDETGIVVVGMTADGHYYVLDDKTLRATPDAWARAAVSAYQEHKADRIVAETNNGGDMVTLLMRQVDSTVSVKKVTATRGKQLRAEPISSLYEQGRVHHVGYFAELEMQMCEWTPQSNESPDRLDALVWAITELNTGGSTMLALASMALLCSNCGMPSPKTASVCAKCGTNLRG